MSYSRSLVTAGQEESFRGYCGLMTSHQLYNLGINSSCIVNDGNKQFDYYLGVPVTSGGYYTVPYFMDDYDLRGALNAVSHNGTRDVTNVLVCFQWTSTESGSLFGHAFLINAILDGVCYFVESFDFSTTSMHPEGSVVIAPIDEVADYFERWTTFEGLIHFGTYADSCDSQSTDAMVMTRLATTLRTHPAPVGVCECQAVRSVAAGERLRATGIFTDDLGQQFYRIREADEDYYIAADAAGALRGNPEGLTLTDAVIPQQIAYLEDAQLGGTVVAENGSISAVEVLISDHTGAPAIRERLEAVGRQWDLAQLNEELELDLLEQGSYTLEIFADCQNPVLVGGKTEVRYGRTQLWQGSLLCGEAPEQTELVAAPEPENNGWVLKSDGWYFYQQGHLVNGWVTQNGVRYCLDAQGKAAVGWQELEGGWRYFTDTGAMVTGWMNRDGEECFFDQDGFLIEE